MDVYEVGGAVRDSLLKQPVKDRDWVVVGATPDALLAEGYKPVGKDFPVFLHPVTKEEYALARTERKEARGYHGFAFHTAPDVTLEADLARRDLTINAIARRLDGSLVDPFDGQGDLHRRLLRHVSPSFTEDPVRILRLARFAARFAEFSVAPETESLMRSMVKNGEVDALVSERVWQELSRGLMEAKPSRMFEVLRGCGALSRLLPEVDRLAGVPQPADHHPEIDTFVHLMMVLDTSARLEAPLAVRYACLGHDLGKGSTDEAEWPRHLGHEERSAALVKQLGERLRVPRDCAELADVVAREHGNIHRSGGLAPAATVRLLERCDALRKPARFEQVLLACECDARGRAGLEKTPYPQAARLREALRAALAVDTATVAAAAAERGLAGAQVGAAVHQARVEAVGRALVGRGLPGPDLSSIP